MAGNAEVPRSNIRLTYEKASVDFSQSYPLTSLILMFIGFSFLGWTWEVGLKFYTLGEFVNRGVLHGPWLPIYGVGGLLMLLLLKHFQNKPLFCFGMGVIICGIVEFTASWALEKFFRAKWWNYSDKFLNLQGRIYPLGLLFFGAAGCLIIYWIAPFLHKKLMMLSKKEHTMLCAIFGLLFIADMIFSLIAPNMGVGISQLL